VLHRKRWHTRKSAKRAWLARLMKISNKMSRVCIGEAQACVPTFQLRCSHWDSCPNICVSFCTSRFRFSFLIMSHFKTASRVWQERKLLLETRTWNFWLESLKSILHSCTWWQAIDSGLGKLAAATEKGFGSQCFASLVPD